MTALVASSPDAQATETDFGTEKVRSKPATGECTARETGLRSDPLSSADVSGGAPGLTADDVDLDLSEEPALARVGLFGSCPSGSPVTGSAHRPSIRYRCCSVT